jgi:hypothetical protein
MCVEVLDIETPGDGEFVTLMECPPNGVVPQITVWAAAGTSWSVIHPMLRLEQWGTLRIATAEPMRLKVAVALPFVVTHATGIAMPAN